MKTLFAGIAALAMSVSLVQAAPALAQGNGNGPGNGNGNKGGGPAAASQGGKPDRGQGIANRGPDRAAERGPGAQRADRQPQARAEGNRGNGTSARAQEQRVDRGNGNGNSAGNRNAAAAAQRGGNDRDVRPVRVERGEREIVRRVNEVRDYRDWNYERDARGWYDDRRRYAGVIDGCPPGLARKNSGCLPPGQAKQLYERYGAYRPSFFGLRGFDDGRYFYNDGYLLRYGAGDLVSGFIPLLGGALSIGNIWPTSYYADSRLPPYYERYYSLGGPGSYRYADDVIYRLDPQTSAITSIAALLTGDEFVVGQRMPVGYDVYNVPYSYRDRYYDTPEYNYRYADGYVYQVNPETQLIAAAIDLLI